MGSVAKWTGTAATTYTEKKGEVYTSCPKLGHGNRCIRDYENGLIPK